MSGYRTWQWAALLALVVLAGPANGQPDGHGDCKDVDHLKPANFSSFTFHAVGDLTVNGEPSSYVKQSKGGQIGVGHGWPKPERKMEDACKLPIRRWTFLVETNFLYNQSALEHQGVVQAILMNPQNVEIIGAVSGTARYLSWTLDPTFEVLLSDNVRVYFFGGSGWFRRTIDFTAAASEGTLLQASAPGVFGQDGNSAVVDGGFGFDVGRSRVDKHPRLSDFRFYWEVRAIHGLAINHGSTLVPVSAGIRW